MPATPVIDVERLHVTYGDFAAAVYGGPEPLILDEPTTGLDIQTPEKG